VKECGRLSCGLVVGRVIDWTTVEGIDTVSVIYEGFTKLTISVVTLGIVFENREGLFDFGIFLLFNRETSVTVVEVDCGGGFVVDW